MIFFNYFQSSHFQKKIESIRNECPNANTRQINNARIPWRDCRNGRIIRVYIRNSDLLYQQQPTVAKSSRSQQTKVNSCIHVSILRSGVEVTCSCSLT
jgi:hypothetical protein